MFASGTKFGLKSGRTRVQEHVQERYLFRPLPLLPVSLTFNLENSRLGVYGAPVGFFTGISFIPPPERRQPHGPSHQSIKGGGEGFRGEFYLPGSTNKNFEKNRANEPAGAAHTNPVETRQDPEPAFEVGTLHRGAD